MRSRLPPRNAESTGDHRGAGGTADRRVQVTALAVVGVAVVLAAQLMTSRAYGGVQIGKQYQRFGLTGSM